jgi:hypothetical protein
MRSSTPSVGLPTVVERTSIASSASELVAMPTSVDE